jgi:small subunit ribosomal protein S1
VEGLVHISEITAEKRLNHPQEVLKAGERVKAMVVSIDREKRMIRLSMKQLVPTDLDEYLAEHKAGDIVTGRVVSVSNDDGSARIEFGDGVFGSCLPASSDQLAANDRSGAGASGNVSALGAQLMARWKGGATPGTAKPEALHSGQIRQFRITRLDADSKLIEVVPA